MTFVVATTPSGNPLPTCLPNTRMSGVTSEERQVSVQGIRRQKRVTCFQLTFKKIIVYINNLAFIGAEGTTR